MKTIYAENIRPTERASRLIIAALMVGAVKVFPDTAPTWMALAAAYPFLTGLLSWDPLYAAYDRMTKGMENVKVTPKRRATA